MVVVARDEDEDEEVVDLDKGTLARTITPTQATTKTLKPTANMCFFLIMTTPSFPAIVVVTLDSFDSKGEAKDDFVFT